MVNSKILFTIAFAAIVSLFCSLACGEERFIQPCPDAGGYFSWLGGPNKNHLGHDYNAPADTTEVKAIADGTTFKIFEIPAKCYCPETETELSQPFVWIKHRLSNGQYFFALYGHIEPYKNIKEGVEVKAGQGIGKIKECYVWHKDKLVPAPHLHFGIWNSESPPPMEKVGYGPARSFVDPIEFLKKNKPYIEQTTEISKTPPVITSPLKITPALPYYCGNTINAEFSITNKDATSITFSVLTVGGRDPDNQVADFTHRQNISLEPSKSYNYQGTLTLNKVGDYHFFCTYQTPDGDWNTSIDLGSGLVDEDRTEDISVEEKEKPSTVPTISGELYIEWDKTFGGSDNDRPYSIVQTNDGGYAVAGSTKSKGAGKLDAWIIKLDNKGNLEWDKTFGGSDNDEAYSMIQTTDGGYVMAGYTYKSGDFFWIIKLDNKGNLEWDKTFGRSNNDQVYSIIQTIDGGYAVVGSTMSSKKPGVTQKCIAWLIKLDDKGNKMWDKIFGRSDNDGVYYSIVQGGIQGGKAYSLIQTNDGGYVVTALTSETLEKDNDLWIIKLDDKGNKIWDKIFKKSGTDYGLGWSFIQTNDGGYATAGHISLKGEGGINALLIKLDNKGNLEWDNTFGGSNCALYSIIQTKDSGYALAGTKFEVPGVWDTWLIKLDNKGNLEWDKTFGGSERNLVDSLIQTNDGGYALVGLTESKGAGEWDAWIIKLSSGSIETLEEEVTEASSSENYYPLDEGRRWEYQVYVNEKEGLYPWFESKISGKQVCTILRQRELKGKKVTPMKIEEIYGGSVYTRFLFYVKDQNSIYEFASQKPKDVEPKIIHDYIIKYPIKVGNSWQETETSSLEPRISVPINTTIESIDEVVTIPAGTFKECLEIKSIGFAEKVFGEEQVWPPKENVKVERERYIWFAPNVGQIKLIFKEKKTCSGGAIGITLSDFIEIVMQLETFK